MKAADVVDCLCKHYSFHSQATHRQAGLLNCSEYTFAPSMARAKNPANPLELVVVRDMLLTRLEAPSPRFTRQRS